MSEHDRKQMQGLETEFQYRELGGDDLLIMQDVSTGGTGKVRKDSMHDFTNRDNHIVIDASGDEDIDLTGIINDYQTFELEGTLTGDIAAIVPDAVFGSRLFVNSMDGAFAVDVETETGTGVEVPQGTARTLRSDGADVVDDLVRPGQVIQEVVATTTTTTSTTSTSPVDAGLEAEITPLRDNSAIEAEVIIPFARSQRVSGSTANRRGLFRIRNITDDVAGPGSWFGRNLVTTSESVAVSDQAVVARMRYIVNSVTARTFRLEFQAFDSNVQVEARAGDEMATMILREIAQ